MTKASPSIVLIGFGEAGQAFAAGWRAAGLTAALGAYDIKDEDPRQAPAYRAACAAHGVEPLSLSRVGVAGARLVFSLVTADQSVAAARAAAAVLPAGAVFCDFNSVAPQAKAEAAAHFATGPSYLDGTILSPVLPGRDKVPVLIAGPTAAALAPEIAALLPNVRVVSDRLGDAAEIKLCRSIVIKGMEALLVECAEAIDALGLAPEAVLPTLASSFPGIDWPARSAYALERVSRHGERRAAEMHEATRMLRAVGRPATMTAATAETIAGATTRSDRGE